MALANGSDSMCACAAIIWNPNDYATYSGACASGLCRRLVIIIISRLIIIILGSRRRCHRPALAADNLAVRPDTVVHGATARSFFKNVVVFVAGELLPLWPVYLMIGLLCLDLFVCCNLSPVRCVTVLLFWCIV